MPIEIRDLRALEGPNLYYGQPAVKLLTWSERDLRQDLGTAIKTWANVLGVVIGYLRQEQLPADRGYLLLTTFTTPLPNVGERMAEAAVADLQAAERQDESYSHDDLMFELVRMREREEPSLPLLQLYAEARARDLPFLPRPDGSVMVGSGARGFVFDPSGLSVGLPVEIPWDTLGRIPVIAVTGTNGKTTTVRVCAHMLAATGKRVGYTDTDGITIGGRVVEEGDWAGFGGARRVLSDPAVDVAVLETSRGGILRRGLGFDTCDVAVITNVSGDHLGDHGVETVEEMARVKGVIAEATAPDGRVVLNADDPSLVDLAQSIRAPIMWFSRTADNRVVQAHRQAGGDAAWIDGGNMVVSYQDVSARLALSDIPLLARGAAAHNVDNVLAAIAACLAARVPIDTVRQSLQTFGASAGDNPGHDSAP